MSSAVASELSLVLSSYQPIDGTVACLLAMLPKEIVQASDEQIHSAFFEFKQEYPDTVKELNFTRDKGYMHYSSELEATLNKFLKDGILKSVPGDYKYLFPTKAKMQVLRYYSDKFPQDYKQNMMELSQRLMALLI